jgi:hypothetical protein
MDSHLIDLTYGALWGLTLISSMMLGRTLQRVLIAGNQAPRLRTILRLPDFALRVYGSNTFLTRRNTIGTTSAFLFTDLASDHVPASREQILAAIGLLSRRYHGKVYIVCSTEENCQRHFEAFEYHEQLAILLDHAGDLARKLAVRKTLTAIVFDAKGRYLGSAHSPVNT